MLTYSNLACSILIRTILACNRWVCWVYQKSLYFFDSARLPRNLILLFLEFRVESGIWNLTLWILKSATRISFHARAHCFGIWNLKSAPSFSSSPSRTARNLKSGFCIRFFWNLRPVLSEIWNLNSDQNLELLEEANSKSEIWNLGGIT